MPLLSLNNLSFTYSNPTLLDGITLHIERGERIGLVSQSVIATVVGDWVERAGLDISVD